MEQNGVVLPSGAWSNELLVPCLAEIAATSYIGDELPPPIDGPEGERPLPPSINIGRRRSGARLGCQPVTNRLVGSGAHRLGRWPFGPLAVWAARAHRLPYPLSRAKGKGQRCSVACALFPVL